ncbi:aldehyde dehydrogenase family protein [Paraburkholderia bannensis]|uniref:aldehyde dehydrogenase family protein n=1 Tax=Paraburkholderia bannensis TaxID=765414 RepID=UPI002AC32E75|nr:aldehyde dehydrogenase family protein [Paraburkholderia bannensis]
MNTSFDSCKGDFAQPRHYGNHIDGQDVQSESGREIERKSPANDATVAFWPDSTAADVNRAVACALAAFEDRRWSGLTSARRADVIRKVAERLKSDDGHLGRIECLETGKPLLQACEEVRWAGDIWDYAAGLARTLHGDSHTNLGDDRLALTLREPVGPVALVTPWNYPLVVLSQKLPFALAAGCTVVLKPSELTSGTALELARILADAGLPPGVFNVVTGYGDPVGQALAEHRDIRAISFTGSTVTGERIVKAAASNMKKVVLELGGKNPNIVFDDADIDAAVDGSIKGFVYNAGAECCSGSRVFVQRPVLEQFMTKLTEQLRNVNVGDPLDPETRMGAITSLAQYEKVCKYIRAGKESGTLVFGGRELTELGGLFVEPTVFADVPPQAPIAREEIFGPVIVVSPFDDIEEAISLANDTDYGLATCLWTSDLNTATTVSRRVKSGIVWVNTFLDVPSEVPIGGNRQSGFGRENGRHAIDEFTALKTVVIQHSQVASRYLA